MELSYDTIQRIIPQLETGEWQYASQYGEPGYEAKGTTPLVVLGDYWCRCDKFGPDEHGHGNKLHEYADHHPKVWAQMVSQGVEFEWCDEWAIDYDNDKAYRTSGDSYSWQPSLVYVEGRGEPLTPDDDLDTWLEHMANDPSCCLPNRVWSAADLTAAGFSQWEGSYESGWHPGQTDDPKAITEQIRQELGDEDKIEVVFLLDESSQFYIGFSAWTRKVEQEDEEG